jgi:hypothetical protein
MVADKKNCPIQIEWTEPSPKPALPYKLETHRCRKTIQRIAMKLRPSMESKTSHESGGMVCDVFAFKY